MTLAVAPVDSVEDNEVLTIQDSERTVEKPATAPAVAKNVCGTFADDEATYASTVINSLPSTDHLAAGAGPYASSDDDSSNDGGSSASGSLDSRPVVNVEARVGFRQAALGGSHGLVQWRAGDKLFSDLLADGLRYKAMVSGESFDAVEEASVVMLFESPSTASKQATFYNSQVFPVHDYPPSKPAYKDVLVPLRYSMMNGATFPSYLRDAPPQELLQHWQTVLPDLELPTFVSDIKPEDCVYAYLPLESIRHHVNDPHVHYHLAGKDALHLMTPNTPRRLANTKDVRPCIAKVTHSMGSKGIFVIRNDEDEQEMNEFIAATGNPSFVVTEFVDIARNVSCHFFIHPSGDIVWIGSSENYRTADGGWSLDAMMVMSEQDELRDLQLPFVREVVDYCLSLGFWGFCGVDVLFDQQGRGHIVDVNPRTTGTCPALMAGRMLESQFGYSAGVFRRPSSYAYPGTAKQLLSAVESFNAENAGQCTILLVSYFELCPTQTLLNIGVYGHDLSRCRTELERFALPIVDEED